MLWIILLLFLVLVILSCRENYTEMFGFSGYKKPVINLDLDYSNVEIDLTGFDKITSELTPDEMEPVAKAAQEFISRKHKLCVYPIETGFVDRYENRRTGDKITKCRFMFTTTETGFPFSFGVTVVVLNGKVIAMRNQSITGDSDIKAHIHDDISEFLPFDKVVPNLSKGILK